MLKLSGRTSYNPIDPWMKFWYDRNPVLFDLTMTYNPIFPIEYYPNLENLVQNQGFSVNDMRHTNPMNYCNYHMSPKLST